LPPKASPKSSLHHFTGLVFCTEEGDLLEQIWSEQNLSKFSGKGGLTRKMAIALWFGIQYASQSVLEGLRSAQFENDEHVQHSMPGGAGWHAGQGEALAGSWGYCQPPN
jgi:hypothetical protein